MIGRTAALGMGLLCLAFSGPAQDPGEALRKVLKDDEVRGPWIYNDLAKGFSEARSSGKPLLVVFR